MNRDVLDKWCERGILGLVLAILIFGPLATGAVRTLEFLIIQGMTVGVMVLWGTRLWLNPRPQLLWPPICWAVIAFALYAVGRYLTADIEFVARQELIRVLVYSFLFFAIVNNLHRQETTQLIVYTLIFLAMAISFYAVYQFVTGSDKVWHFVNPYKGRGSGTYICPNHLAGFLEMLLPLGLAFTLISRAKPLGKIFLGYASLAIVAGIAVSLSRGSWISVGVVLLVFFGVLAFHRMYRLPALALLVLLVGVGVFAIPKTHSFEARFKKLLGGENVENDMRFALWKPAVEMWRDHVWWGTGPAHFNYRFRSYRPEVVQLQPNRAHNDFVNTLADWGAVGTALVASAWLLLLLGVIKTWREVRNAPADLGGKNSNKFGLVFGASLGLLAILLHSWVDFNMHIPANAILAVTLMALLSGYTRFATDRYWFTARVPVKLVLTAVLLAGVVYLGWQGTRRATEYAWLERAARLPETSTARVAALEKAFAIEPMNWETAYAIGEILRRQSWEGPVNYEELAEKAMSWFERSIHLNQHDSKNLLGYGMCLDWLERYEEGWGYIDRASRLDPNNYFVVAHVGWHFAQTGNYAAARPWLERSRRLQWKDNPIATSYLEIVKARMLENAAEPAALRLEMAPTEAKHAGGSGNEEVW